MGKIALNRREFLKGVGVAASQLAFGGLLGQKTYGSVPVLGASLAQAATDEPDVSVGETLVVRSHQQSLSEIARAAADLGAASFLPLFKQLLTKTAQQCVLAGQWVVPSQNYAHYLFARDSFWLLATLRDKDLSAGIVRRFRDDQVFNGDGHIATALYRDGSRPTGRDHDEESTLMYVLTNYVLATLGGRIDPSSLSQAYKFIASHVRDHKYITMGEAEIGRASNADQIGTYHYWADTFRPAGRALATREVISYNQGLYCLALRCLRAMGIETGRDTYEGAAQAYLGLVNPEDGLSLPQRENSTIVDVSAITGEAVSLYLFDTPLLNNARVVNTIARLSKTYYPDGSFLGHKVISDFYGGYRPTEEFSGTDANAPGNYHNGGSRLLNDTLALYVAVRYGIPGSAELFVQRLISEFRSVWASHEFISTNPDTLGGSEAWRDGYAWNTFILNLIP